MSGDSAILPSAIMNQLDTQSFSRFLVSLGVSLCVVAFIGPVFAIRETSVLRVSQRELASLTPTAQKEIKHRQNIETAIGRFAPYVGGVLLLAGGCLIGLGLPRLRSQERIAERTSLAKLNALLTPQSASERRERIEDNVVQYQVLSKLSATETVRELRTADIPFVPAPSPPPAAREAPEVVASQVERAKAVEDLVLAQIPRIVPASFEVFEQTKLSSVGASFDALLASRQRGERDIVVEIKYVNAPVDRFSGSLVAAAAAKLVMYSSETGRDALLWLIIVSEAPPAELSTGPIEAAAKPYGSSVSVTVIGANRIDKLQFPDREVSGAAWDATFTRASLV